MLEINEFTFKKQPVRVVGVEEKPMFVIRDICRILGINNPNHELIRLAEDHPEYGRLYTRGNHRIVRLVTRPVIEKLLSSHSGHTAEQMTRWLKRTVFPKYEKHAGCENHICPGCRKEADNSKTSPVGNEFSLLAQMAFDMPELFLTLFGLPIPVKRHVKKNDR